MATTTTLGTRALNRALLARQLLLARKRMSVADAVHAVGGLQSQEPKDPYVALWSRLRGFKAEQLRAVAESRMIVRGTYLRGTIHTLSATDYADFRLLLQPMLDRVLRIEQRFSNGVDTKALERAARALLVRDPLSAQRLGDTLAPAFPKAQKEDLAQWIRTCVPLVMVPTDDRYGYPRPPRFVTADQWLDRPLRADPSAATQLVLRCLSAIGPATSSDVRTWSGLAGVKPLLEELRPRLVTFNDDSGRELFDLPDAPRPRADTPAPPRFLPEYDNTFLSHADRTRIVLKQHIGRFTEAKNGRRLRALLVDGFVRGAWSITRQRDTATIQVLMFEKFPKATIAELSQEAEALVRFLEPDATQFLIDAAA